MVVVVLALQNLISRWSCEGRAALRQTIEGKTTGERLAGMAHSRRVEAKFIMLAAIPFIPIIVGSAQGWSHNAFWQFWLWLSIAWAIVISSKLLAIYFGSVRPSDGNRRAR